MGQNRGNRAEKVRTPGKSVSGAYIDCAAACMLYFLGRISGAISGTVGENLNLDLTLYSWTQIRAAEVIDCGGGVENEK